MWMGFIIQPLLLIHMFIIQNSMLDKDIEQFSTHFLLQGVEWKDRVTTVNFTVLLQI